MYIDPNIPGLPPPPGHTSNFNNPYSLEAGGYAFGAFCVAASTITTAARCYTRFFISRVASWDDYCMIIAWIAYSVNAGFELKANSFGGGTHQWDVRLVDVLQFAKWGYASVIVYPIAIASVKLSICLQLLRIFCPIRNAEFWAVSTFTAIQMAFWFAVFWATIFQCDPVAKNFNPLLPGTCFVDYQKLGMVLSVFNLASDILMFTYPLVCVARLHLPRRQKIGVGAIFLVGSTTIAVTIIRVIFSVRWLQNNHDATFRLTQIAFCTSAEIIAGMIAGNAVCLPGFFTYIGKKSGSITSSVNSRFGLLSKRSKSDIHRETSMSHDAVRVPSKPTQTSWLVSFGRGSSEESVTA